LASPVFATFRSTSETAFIVSDRGRARMAGGVSAGQARSPRNHRYGVPKVRFLHRDCKLGDRSRRPCGSPNAAHGHLQNAGGNSRCCH
jgi:hypothetical protein